MVMDGSQIINNLDSLWFFSNVFSSTSQEQVDHVSTTELTDQEEAAKDMNLQAEENQKNDEDLVKMCTKCEEFAAEIESLKVVVEQVGQAVEELANKTEDKKKESSSTSSSSNSRSSSRRRRRRSRRSKRSLLLNERRQIFGELDLGFYGQMESPWLLDDQETTFEFENLGTQQQQQQQQHHVNMKKMPPLNDGLAMKQHLKSWAYAVACTVR